MAFICTLGPPGFNFEVFEVPDPKRTLLFVPIGYDDTEDRSYSLFICFGPDVYGDTELTFNIVEYDGEEDCEYEHWYASGVARFINREDRQKIRSALLMTIRRFINAIKPKKVFMCTNEPYAPDAAMVKYAMIAKVFEESGYIPKTADPYHGVRVWWMERIDAVPG